MFWTTLEISTPRCALMCYPSSNITYCIACLLCIGVILLNKFNSIQWGCSFSFCQIEAATGAETVDWRVYKALTWVFFRKVNVVPYQLCE